MAEVYTAAAVRVQIGKYLAAEIDRAQLDDWLFPLLWANDGPADALELGWDAELRLMEASRGHLTEEELRERLRGLAAPSVPA